MGLEFAQQSESFKAPIGAVEGHSTMIAKNDGTLFHFDLRVFEAQTGKRFIKSKSLGNSKSLSKIALPHLESVYR
jgi:hypothetical protein